MAEVATAHLLLQEKLPRNQHGKTTEEKEGADNQKTGPTPLPRELEHDARGLEKQWVKRRSGLRAVAQVRVCSDTEPLVDFSELLVATHGVQFKPLNDHENPFHWVLSALRTLTSPGLVWPSGL